MSVQRHSNGGTMVVTLGDGDTMIATAGVESAEASDCLVFFNGPARTGYHELHGDEVVIQFTSVDGALSLFRSVGEMLATWPIGNELQAQCMAMAQEIGTFIDRGDSDA